MIVRVIMLVLLFALAGSAAALCPAGYTQFNGGDCFTLYYTNQTTFVVAEMECVSDGGHLASLHSIEEQHALATMIVGENPLIGMKCDDEAIANCSWTDGSAVDFQNFPGGVPVLSYGGCVRLGANDDMWYSWNCAAPTDSFLCRVPYFEDISPVPVTVEPVATTTVDHIKNCPKQQYIADTYVFSPNWPSIYPSGVDCLYFIQSKNNRKLTIQFEYVETVPSSDIVYVYDGPDTNSRIIANVTGKNGAAIWQYYSTGPTVTLDFISKSPSGGKGWSAAIYNV